MKLILLGLLLMVSSGCAFKAPMEASPTGDGKYWVLKAPLVYMQQNKEVPQIVAPRGFVTDFASVPRLFWSVLPTCGKYVSAAVIHDYLYWFQPANCDRECADDVLLKAMEDAGVDLVTRRAIHIGVRAKGGSSWEENRELKAKGAIRLIPEEFLNFSPNDSWATIESQVRLAKKP
jgi:hypothetical protein